MFTSNERDTRKSEKSDVMAMEKRVDERSREKHARDKDCFESDKFTLDSTKGYKSLFECLKFFPSAFVAMVPPRISFRHSEWLWRHRRTRPCDLVSDGQTISLKIISSICLLLLALVHHTHFLRPSPPLFPL